METDVKSRIIKFLKYKNISASQFSQQIGASRNYVSSMSKSVQPDKLHSISIQFPELNIEWLLIGKGEMLHNNLPDQLTTNNDHNQNSIDMNTDKLIAVIESQNVMIRQKDEEIRQLRAELDELRGYSPIKKSRVG